jgi:hypothetical protein
VILKNVNIFTDAILFQEMARLKMKLFIKGIQSTLVDDFDTLPDAPFNRHHVKKKKKCLCQILEHDIENTM